MNYFFSLLLGAAFVIAGIANMFGYGINRSVKEDYTEDSIRRWRVWGGTSNCLYGLALIVLSEYFETDQSLFIIFAAVLAALGVFVAYRAMKKYLVRNEE